MGRTKFPTSVLLHGIRVVSPRGAIEFGLLNMSRGSVKAFHHQIDPHIAGSRRFDGKPCVWTRSPSFHNT